MTREEWILRFCQVAGVDPPSPAEMEAILSLAATAAHGSERPAAPIACWVAGRSDRSLDELGAIALTVAEAEG